MGERASRPVGLVALVLAVLALPATAVTQVAHATSGQSATRCRAGGGRRPTPRIASGLATLETGSNRPITFGGHRQVSIAPGASGLSDPVALAVRADQDVAVSLYAPGAPVNDHAFPPFAADPPARYIGTGGDTARDVSATSFPGNPVVPGDQAGGATGYHPGQVWWLDLLVADRTAAAGTLVTLGDSITDGYHADGPPGQRWTDVLADRLQALPAGRRLAVANAGISGNTVSVQPNPYDETGQSIAHRLHARGLRVVGATVLPMCLAAGSKKEANRLAVNRWIRAGSAFDAVVDFDAVLRDPADPTTMIKGLAFDCYHPNAAGDALLGAAVPLQALTR